jgi:hypothetical protein
MRDALKKANPELAESPVLMPEPGEPQDMEELEMQMAYTHKHQMSIESQNAWRLVAYQNDFVEERKITIENLYDYGVGGYKEWIEGGKTKIRAINPANMITGYCRFGDFRDALGMGEVTEVAKADLAEYFSKEELDDMNPQPRHMDSRTGLGPKQRTSVEVLDLVIRTTDDKVMQQGEDDNGNLTFDEAPWASKFNKVDKKVKIKGKEEPKYIPKKVRELYHVCWVIGTDYVYQYGRGKNKKRDISNPTETTMPYHLYSYNFHEMRCLSMMQRLIPIIDEYQMTIYKIQNFKNRWIPYIIKLDLDSLEAVALGKGGENMTPLQLLDMMWQSHVMVSRSKDVSASNPNYKSIEVLPTQMAQEFTVLVADLGRLLQDMAEISGLNDLTDGSTPNPKMLTTTAQMGYEASKNAIFPLLDADRKLHERTAKGCVQRVQTAIRNGHEIQGVAPALGKNTVEFIKVSQDLALHDIGIMARDMPTEQQKMQLLDRLNMKDAQGLIDPEDYVMIMNIDDLKQAEQLLAFRVKKRREKQLEEQQQIMKTQSDGAIAANQSAEAEKRKTMELEYQLKTQLENTKGEWQMRIAGVKVEGQNNDAQTSAGAKIAGQAMQQFGKEREEKIKQGIPVEDDDAGIMQQLQGQQQPMEEEIDPAMQEQMMAEQQMQG